MSKHRDIQYTAGSYNLNAYISAPAQGGPGVIVLHAWWGLTPFFKRLCDRLAERGFTTIAPDLYGGVVARTVEQASQAMESSNDAYKQASVMGALAQLRLLPGAQTGKLGVIGFSMGAAWSVVLSTLAPNDIAAVVLFYGAYLLDFKQASAAYLGHFSATDEWEPLEGIQLMQTELLAAGREAIFHFYPGAGHWFFEDDRPDAYQPEAAALAWERTLEFLQSHLQA